MITICPFVLAGLSPLLVGDSSFAAAAVGGTPTVTVAGAPTVFVDCVRGSDDDNGTAAAPHGGGERCARGHAAGRAAARTSAAQKE